MLNTCKDGFSKVLLIVLIFFVGIIVFSVWQINKNVSLKIHNMEMVPPPPPKPIWERKVETDQVLKIGLITDTHVHPNRIDKIDNSDFAPRVLKGKHLEPLNKFNLQMTSFVPDLIIHLIMLDANYKKDGTDTSPGNGHIPGNVNQNTIDWLEEKLKTNKRVFVFMHQAPVVKKNENGSSIKDPISNSEAVVKIFDKYNVEAVFSGHIELKSYINIDGVKYYSLPGTRKSGIYKKSFYELTINSVNPQVKMFYTDKESGIDNIIYFKDNDE